MNLQSSKLEPIKMITDIQSEELLNRVKQFLVETEGTIKASKKPPSLSKEETRLLLKINEGLPEETQLRYNELLKKLTEAKITAPEHKEFLQLTTQVEAKNAERLKYLFQLANLWDISVDDVMERLGIKPPGVIHA